MHHSVIQVLLHCGKVGYFHMHIKCNKFYTVLTIGLEDDQFS